VRGHGVVATPSFIGEDGVRRYWGRCLCGQETGASPNRALVGEILSAHCDFAQQDAEMRNRRARRGLLGEGPTDGGQGPEVLGDVGGAR
jgi:hypothetical protein